ncbi:phosphatase 2C-like domain-containing protein, partial [Dimargaris cristalligena]
VLRYDTNQLASNNPIEDRHQEWSLPLASPAPSESLLNGLGRWLMFSVFDGHAGYQCADKVAQSLPDHTQRALTWSLNSEKEKHPEAPANATRVAHHTLTNSFVTMDEELLEGSLQNVINNPTQAREMLLPAVAGACGLVACIDSETRQLSVASAGDSRAVLGSLNGTTGEWTATPLNDDHTADNPAERQRLIDEHPGEAKTVISRGRVLGSLMPTRAFGDARYKWSEQIQAQLFPTQFPGRRATPKHYQTPPYVTAHPEVSHRNLTPSDKFIVVASDGLYDELSNKEIVQAVAEFWESRIYNNPDPKLTKAHSIPDDNAATHLIRRAYGGDNPKIISRLLAIPSPKSRSYRDDITVTIVFL